MDNRLLDLALSILVDHFDERDHPKQFLDDPLGIVTPWCWSYHEEFAKTLTGLDWSWALTSSDIDRIVNGKRLPIVNYK